jgi:uncharacterized repeat protein (TIGR04138 family)
MQTVKFEENIEKILSRDNRYHRDAYLFIREALDFTQKNVLKTKKERVHVSGQQLLEGIKGFALQEYGPMALALLNAWGITCCEDFGNIVYNMVKAEMFMTTEKDSLDDFKSCYDFDEAFRAPYLPTKKAAAPPEELKVAKE